MLGAGNYNNSVCVTLRNCGFGGKIIIRTHPGPFLSI